MKFAKKKKTDLLDDCWNILIVDDDEEVHSITNIVLRNFSFQNKQIKLYDTFNIADTKKLLNQKSDFALIFLDIVMETDDAGLVLTKYIREELNNHDTRIILRTGQPGSAPEQQIIIDYDINDYKEKTELSATKLTTSVVSSLRAYSELLEIKKHEKQLEEEIKINIEEISDKNDIIHDKIMNLDNNELMCEISDHLKKPIADLDSDLSTVLSKIDLKEIEVEELKNELKTIHNKIKQLSLKVNGAKNK